MEEGSGDPQAPPVLLPKHTIFLSHSGAEKVFVEQLYVDLENAYYFPFFDQRTGCIPIGEQFPKLIFDAARKCLVAVIVLSQGFLTSKWPMLELIAFVQALKKDNPDLKLVPLFYKINPDDLRDKRQELWDELVRKHGDGAIKEESYNEAIGKLRSFNGLRFERYGRSEVQYRKDVVDEICKCLPPALPIEISAIHGSKRLCEVISGMFVADKLRGCQYLGLYGKPGLGKSTVCCEAMCHFFQEKSRGRFCRVKLEVDKAADGKSAAKAADKATKKRLDRLILAIKQLVGLHKSMSGIMSEEQGKKYLKDRLGHQPPVFLVVDNVSESSQDEAKWYVNAGFASGSKVLVTSRSREILEKVLGGSEYCKPIPCLEEEEASELFLSTAAPSKSLSSLEPTELRILKECVHECFIDGQFIPFALTALASYLQDRAKDNILSWKEYLQDPDGTQGSRELETIFRFLRLEFETLDEMSKLIFLDLAVFANGMSFTHMDFHADYKWDELSNFKLVVSYISMMHGIEYYLAERKVKNLQRISFLIESNTQISVSDCYFEFAVSLIKRNQEVKKLCMICEEGEDLPDEYPSGLVRLFLWGVSVDRDVHNIPEWSSTLQVLMLVQVQNLRTLDLQGLRSLRVLRVEECDDLEKIVCSCNSSPSGGPHCYLKQRGPGCLSELKVVQLECLLNLKEASFPMHSRKLETLWFLNCPNLGCLPDLHLCIRLKKLRLPCGDFNGFQGLGSNQALTELAFHWDPDTVKNFTTQMRKKLLLDVMNLTYLTVLDIVDEREVYKWIPKGTRLDVGRLVRLTFLDLSCAHTIQEIEGLEQLSQLTSLGLYGCCELRTLPDLTGFKHLKRLCISHCQKLPEEVKGSMPVEVKDFHMLGDSCSFGEHQCLDPAACLDPDNCITCDPRDEWEESEESDNDGGRICQPEDWEELNEPDNDQPQVSGQADVEICPLCERPSSDTTQATIRSYPVRVSEKQDEESLTTIPAAHEQDERIFVTMLAAQEQHEEAPTAIPAAHEQDENILSILPAPHEQHEEICTATSAACGQDEGVLTAILASQDQDDASDNSVNILLLGETGVGKSTFINALCNYLTFDTLDEARAGEMQSLIYSEFITSTDDYEERKIAVGVPDNDENASSKDVGSSCTQKCKAYTFKIGETKLIRLVDTPGIGDTRGFDQDVKNMKDILSYISRYEMLHAICILLKPNEERLTTSLKYCIVELLAHLHKDASSNILFCFTNSRSTMFRVGGTRNLLKALLAESPQTAAVKLDKSTMYHFDSEGFRFLACVKNGLHFSDIETDTFRSSWRSSTDEASRLIQHIASLTPHDIQSTLSLNRMRDILATIEVPLAEISAGIESNLDENRKVMKDLLESHGSITDKLQSLIIKEQVQVTISLGHLRTICNRLSCKGKICHDNCCPTETVLGSIAGYVFGADDVGLFCNKLSVRAGKCRICHCPNDAHIRVSHEIKTLYREREDEIIRRVIDKTVGEIQQREQVATILKRRDQSMKEEMEIIVNAAALFAGFLAQNSIFTYHAATQEYLREQIKMKKHCDGHDTPEGKARIAELESLLDTYERQVRNFKNRSGPGSGKDVTQEDVKAELNKLFALKENGKSLRTLMDDVEREYRRAALRREEVACKVPRVSINQAESTSTHGGGTKSLLEKLADMTINRKTGRSN